MLSRKINIKLYDRDGTFKYTLSNKDLRWEIFFYNELNTWFGSLEIVYENVDNFDIFDYSDLVKVYDQWEVVYFGYVIKMRRQTDQAGKRIRVKTMWYQALLRTLIYKDWASVEFTKTDDPSTLIEDIIGQYNTEQWFAEDLFTFKAWGLDTYGTNVSINFQRDTLLSALKKVLDKQKRDLIFLPTGEVVYQSSGSNTRYTLGDELISVQQEGSIDNLVNDITIESDGGSTSYATDSTSETAYGKHEKYELDTSINDATTANEKANKEIEKNKEPRGDTSLDVIKDNSLVVGDTITTRNLDKNIVAEKIERIEWRPINMKVFLEKAEDLQFALDRLSKWI